MPKKTVNVGLIGYAFMGKAHSNALKDVDFFFPDVKLKPVRKAICGRTESAVREAAERFGWESYETDWRKLVRREDIDVVDIVTPGNAHAEQVVGAAEACKHIICEKPIATTLADAKRMAAAVQKAGVRSFVMFNYRRVPAIAFARELVKAGEIGEVYHFRAFYLQDWITDPEFPLVWRLEKKKAGSGSLGDIGSHIIDMAQFLVGDISEVVGTMKTFIKERPILKGAMGIMAGRTRGPKKMGKVTVDDAAAFIANFANGAIGTFEATRFATGRKNFNGFELYGSKGSICFDFDDMNRLQFYSKKDAEGREGFRDIHVTEPNHPYMQAWWPPGHIIGYEHTFINAMYDFFNALSRGKDSAPTIPDAVKVQAVLEAVETSSKERAWVRIRDLM
jgi:predicted dehydrogenase